MIANSDNCESINSLYHRILHWLSGSNLQTDHRCFSDWLQLTMKPEPSRVSIYRLGWIGNIVNNYGSPQPKFELMVQQDCCIVNDKHHSDLVTLFWWSVTTSHLQRLTSSSSKYLQEHSREECIHEGYEVKIASSCVWSQWWLLLHQRSCMSGKSVYEKATTGTSLVTPTRKVPTLHRASNLSFIHLIFNCTIHTTHCSEHCSE